MPTYDAARTLQGKVALVTGAGRGLGRAFAERLASLGADIAIHGMREHGPAEYGEGSTLTAVAAEVAAAHGVRTIRVLGDLTQGADIARLVEATTKELGPIDILVHNAGGDIATKGGKPDPNDAVGIREEDVRAVLDRNLLSTILTCQAVAKEMMPRRQGRIVTIGSVAAFKGRTNGSIYAVAKAGMTHYTRCLADQLRSYDITVNCIAPGDTRTGRFMGTRAVDKERLIETGTLDRIATVDEVARVVEVFAGPLGAWVDSAGILNVRSSTQVPFLTRRTLADLFHLPPDKVRVFCERVGGGFGGKQEMFVEDILALAALKTGRPVKFELTREEQFIATSTRHPMRVTVKAGADKDGKLTALQLDVLSNTGAYGNHAGPVLFHSVNECISVYSCPNKKVDGIAAYTNTVPAGAFRGYGLPQALIAVEAAIDELANRLGISPFEMRRRNVVKPGDPMLSPPESEYHDVLYGSYGLDQCLDLVERAMAAEAPTRSLSADWLTGDGIALTMIDTVPPAGHFADSSISLRADGGFDLTVGTTEFGNGTSTVHRQIAASALATTVDRIHLKQSDTAHGGHDTGAYGSAGTFVAGRATQAAAEALAGQLKQFAASLLSENPDTCSLDNHATVCAGRRTPFALLAASAHSLGRPLRASGNSSGTPRSVAFNVQGFRVAVNKYTGELKILKSVQAADAGRVANPMQCRGQVEGGVAQSLGAALYEEMVIDDNGRVINPKFRDYHLPSFADIPRTEAFFADTSDTLGPMGAKSMSESPYNPVAAALGNAIANATGIRFTATPFKPDRLWPMLHEKFGR